MKKESIEIEWPNGELTNVTVGSDWIRSAYISGNPIPTGCLGGSCGACEIEVDGEIVRACISKVPSSDYGRLKVTYAADPFW